MKRIFIGSSSEHLHLAEKAKEILEPDFEVSIWNEKIWEKSVFKLNNNFLDDLLKASLQFDFGILIGTKDDKVINRGRKYMAPRDNVLFELGLFMGRLGISRCALIVDKDLKVLTDMSGINLARFSSKPDSSFSAAVEQVEEFFVRNDSHEINFFPSSTLAAVYFENLVKPLCTHIINNGGFEVNGTRYPTCHLKVVIPDRIHRNVNLQFEKMKLKHDTETVTFESSGRPRSVTIEAEILNDTLVFVDFPTVLAGINHAISNLLPHEFNSSGDEYERLLNRELDRFIGELLRLARQEGMTDMLDVIRE